MYYLLLLVDGTFSPTGGRCSCYLQTFTKPLGCRLFEVGLVFNVVHRQAES
jgi:hypothetical protein